jgi:hypothetical protein
MLLLQTRYAPNRLCRAVPYAIAVPGANASQLQTPPLWC